MRLIHDMADFGPGGCAAALGTFDGVHIGHAQLIQETVRLAREFGVSAAALTFDRHPLALIRPDAVPEPLTSPAEKHARLKALGLDTLIEQPFTHEFAALTPEEFFGRMYESLRPRALIVGFNYTFGRKGAGNAGLLACFCREKGVLCRIMEPVCVDGKPVSSSRIRALLRAGATDEARRLLDLSSCVEDCNNLK